MPQAAHIETALVSRGMDSPFLDSVVDELNDLQRGATVDLAYRMGKLIVERLYGGSLAVWRSHAAKESSFRKLAERSGNDLNVSASTLFRSVALFELTERVGVSALKHLSASHVCAVFGLPDEHQRRLLSEAQRQSWTTKRIEAEAATLREKQGGKRGRRPLPGFVKTANRLGALLSDRDQALAGLDGGHELDDAELERVAAVLEAARHVIDRLQEHVDSQLKTR